VHRFVVIVPLLAEYFWWFHEKTAYLKFISLLDLSFIKIKGGRLIIRQSILNPFNAKNNRLPMKGVKKASFNSGDIHDKFSQGENGDFPLPFNSAIPGTVYLSLFI